jgi:hypothetical protein
MLSQTRIGRAKSEFDPLRTFAGVGYRAVQIAVRLSKFECSRDYLVAERDVHRQKW